MHAAMQQKKWTIRVAVQHIGLNLFQGVSLMFGFLTVVALSVAAFFAAQALDIEGGRPARPTAARKAARTDAVYPGTAEMRGAR